MKMKTSTISELCNVEYGTRVTRKKDGGNIYPVYGGGGETFFINKKKRKNRIVIARFAMSKKCTRFIKGDFFLNDSGLTLSPKTKELSQNYLDSIIPALNDSIYNMGKGTAQRNLDMRQFRLLKISYPASLSEQQSIVVKLEVAFAEIDKIKKFEEIKIKKNKTIIQKYLDNIFTSNKNLQRLNDCVEINPPKREVNNLDDDTEVSFMPMKDMGINNQLSTPNQKRKLKDVRGAYTYFSEGDVLLAKITPCFENGKMGIASNLLNGVGFGSSEYIVFRPNKILKREWLYYFLNRSEFRRKGAQNMSGAVGHKRVDKDFISNTFIPIPSLGEQNQIILNLKNLSTKSKTINEIILKKENQLNLLKQSIFKKLLNNNLLVAV